MLINLVRKFKNFTVQNNFGAYLISVTYNCYKKFVLGEKNFKIFKSQKYWIHQTSVGLLAYNRPIFNPEEYVKENYEIFFEYYLPKTNDVVIELGSGVGNETIYISSLIGKQGKVIAVEPFKEIFDLLRKTIEINNVKNVLMVNKAIYKSNTEIGFLSDKSNWLGGKIDKNSKEKMPTITLNNLVIENKLSKIDFCKINIEGAEKYILESSDLFLKICNNFAIECHDFLDDEKNKTHLKVKNFLRENNFKIKLSKRNKYPWDKYYVFAYK